MHVDVTVETDVSTSARARQLEAMFDVPAETHQRQQWVLDAPLDEQPWNVGLIVGPSGAGKTIVLRTMFGDERSLTWDAPSVVDAFDESLSMQDVSSVCMAVGFNTIPAWLRPYDVLSNGEQFRVHMARLMIEAAKGSTIVVDEFTSVVDRQVAQIGAHAVSKHIRRLDGRFVAATCHYDVIDWLQPDWIIEPASRKFTWRSVQPRPRIECEVRRVPYSVWHTFAPFHYLTPDLNRTARCFALFVDDRPAAFAGVLKRPHAKARNISGVSRLVTLPDWQGLGLAFVLVDAIASAYTATGERLRTYPAHPALIRGFDRSEKWVLRQQPGFKSSNRRGVVHGPNAQLAAKWRHGSRPCAVFEYVGDRIERDAAQALIDGK
jgi:ABC-type ATPase involved in cell division